jgi:2-oxoglutarate dehydrogenase E2 component (dihydrolipoamide succinyltransferase)
MAVVDLVMPKMGESITEATILKWRKKSGERVEEDETLLEIATDKVDSEVPSTTAGILEEVLFQENDVVPVGAVIARINTNGAEQTFKPAPATAQVLHTPAVQDKPIAAQVKPQGEGQPNHFYSPLVMNIASSEGISMTELEQIPGTGHEGRVTKKDILSYVEKRTKPSREQQRQETHQAPATMQNTAQTSYNGNVELVEMDRMRRAIADHMVRSKQTSPHVTSFSEADVTNLVMWRERVKKDFEKREQTKLTFTPLFIEAVIRCIKKYPLINSSLDGSTIVMKKDINIGMATALPSGNLIVPVIKNADQLNLTGLAKQVNQLADNARTGKLKPDDTQGGTFTLTNVGTFGSLMGTPIINQPQVAILAVGAIKKRPVVLETAQGDSIAIRHMMYLSMSYDHRIIDGSLGATFLTAVARELENFNPEREF